MRQGHTFQGFRRAPWAVRCIRCGHMPLNNGISRLVTVAGCDYAKDPRYLRWVADGRPQWP